MRATHTRLAVITALVLGLATPTAIAANASEPSTGASKSAAAKAAHKPAKAAKPAKAVKPVKPAAAPESSASAEASKPAKAAKPSKAAKAAKPAKANHGSEVSKAAKAKHLNKFVSHGFVTAVDSAAGTVTFTVRGGRDKALRGKPLTVKLSATAKVTRNDAVATLANVVVGDHVNAKGTKAGTVYTATRVSASTPEAEDQD